MLGNTGADCFSTENFLPTYFHTQKCLENQEVERVFQSVRVAGGAGCKFIKPQGETKKHFPPVTPFKRLFWSRTIKSENYQCKYSLCQLLPIWFYLNIILWLKHLPKSFFL